MANSDLDFDYFKYTKDYVRSEEFLHDLEDVKATVKRLNDSLRKDGYDFATDEAYLVFCYKLEEMEAVKEADENGEIDWEKMERKRSNDLAEMAGEASDHASWRRILENGPSDPNYSDAFFYFHHCLPEDYEPPYFYEG